MIVVFKLCSFHRHYDILPALYLISISICITSSPFRCSLQGFSFLTLPYPERVHSARSHIANNNPYLMLHSCSSLKLSWAVVLFHLYSFMTVIRVEAFSLQFMVRLLKGDGIIHDIIHFCRFRSA